MKFFTTMVKRLVILFVIILISAQVHSQNKLSLNINNASIKEVLQKIEAETNYRFIYESGKVDVDKKVTVNATDQTVEQILATVFKGGNMEYIVTENNTILISPKKEETKAVQKDISVSGTVIDSDGLPLPGVSVFIKGTTTGLTTNGDGKYTIVVPNSNTILSFSFVGFSTQEKTVGNSTVLNVTMTEDTEMLGDVIVTALGIKRDEKSLGYSVQKIGGDALQKVKGTNVATSLTGKIAGLTIKNSTELLEAPEMTLRGGTPLIVIDEVAYGNMKLKDISPDDIESIDVLKGATASALYGVRGRNGAIMITTKKGDEGKLTITASNNTMFNAGFLRIPKNQSSYSSGKVINGRLEYDKDYVWGAYMDGSMVDQYDGITKDYKSMPLTARGKDNLKNFIENSFVSTTNMSVAQSGQAGSFRISGTHSHTKGQFPNSKLTRYTLSGAGTIKYGKFKASANFNIGKMVSPNVPNRNQYGSGNIIYNMIVWTGTDYDVRDFKDYWKVKDEKQNWMYKGWYDNPYFIANEYIHQLDQSISAGSVNLNYDFGKYLKLQLRSGFDSYSNETMQRRAISSVQEREGYYGITESPGWSWSNDFLATSKLEFKDFKFDLMAGASSYYYEDMSLAASTNGGISIPGFYSLASSKSSPNVSRSEYRKLVYSAFGKISIDYNSMVYLDVTGRNDWSSTLSKGNRSYFYPSFSLSFVPTEIYNPIPEIMDFWKLRSSWTVSKQDPSVYGNNLVYSVSSNVWDGNSTGVYPTTLNDPNMEPNTEESFEIGTDIRFFKGRLSFDYTYFRKKQYNRIINATISGGSGFSSMYINTDEDRIQKGMEFTVKGRPIENKNFVWTSTFNLGFYHWYYNEFDSEFSTHDPRIKKGTRTDRYMLDDWQKTADGQYILNAGLPIRYPYTTNLGYTDPKFVFGFTNDFSIGAFDISLSFDGRVGGVMYAQTNQAMYNSGAHPDSDNQYRYDEVVNGKKYLLSGVKIASGKLEANEYGEIISDTRVFVPNDQEVVYSNYIKHIHGNAYTARPDNIVDATFIKLREMSVNYNLPASISKKAGFKKVTVGLVGQNLFMWTKSKEFKYSDPDRGWDGMNSPSIRLIGFNLNIVL